VNRIVDSDLEVLNPVFGAPLLAQRRSETSGGAPSLVPHVIKGLMLSGRTGSRGASVTGCHRGGCV